MRAALFKYFKDRASIMIATEAAAEGINLQYSAWPQTTVSVAPLVGKSETLSVRKLSITVADAQDHIILTGLTDDDVPIDQNAAMRLFDLTSKKADDSGVEIPDAIRQGINACREAILQELAEQQAQWFDAEMDKLDNWAEDKRARLKVELKDLDDRVKELKRQVRQTGNLPDKLALQKQVGQLAQKRDEAWRDYDTAAKQVEGQKDTLLDQVEEQLQQQASDQALFTIRFMVL